MAVSSIATALASLEPPLRAVIHGPSLVFAAMGHAVPPLGIAKMPLDVAVAQCCALTECTPHVVVQAVLRVLNPDPVPDVLPTGPVILDTASGVYTASVVPPVRAVETVATTTTDAATAAHAARISERLVAAADAETKRAREARLVDGGAARCPLLAAIVDAIIVPRLPPAQLASVVDACLTGGPVPDKIRAALLAGGLDLTPQ